MDYITLNQLKKRLYSLFNLMAEANYQLRIGHKGKLYILHIELTNEKPKRRRPRVKRKLDIKQERCSHCGELMIAGVCIDNCQEQ